MFVALSQAKPDTSTDQQQHTDDDQRFSCPPFLFIKRTPLNRHKAAQQQHIHPTSQPARGPTPVAAQKAAYAGSELRFSSLLFRGLTELSVEPNFAALMVCMRYAWQAASAASTLRHDLARGLARAAPLGDHGAAGLLLLLLALGVQAEYDKRSSRGPWAGWGIGREISDINIQTYGRAIRTWNQEP